MKELNKRIRIAAVSYLNTKPLTYAFEHGAMSDSIELSFEYPSKVALDLLNDRVDVGLVPIAVIPLLNESYIISDYCISTEGEVASVCLFSQVPLNEIETIKLDYQSKTSVALLKILLKYHWKLSPNLTEASEGYETTIKGSTAGLVIGDRALIQRSTSTYIYDLGLAWKEMTGLPFVFAAWVANKILPSAFIHTFNEATSQGLQHIDKIVADLNFNEYDMKKYYTININYQLNKDKIAAMQKFTELLSHIE